MAPLPQKRGGEKIENARQHQQQAHKQIEPFEHGKKLGGLELWRHGIRLALPEFRIHKDRLEDQEMEAEKANSRNGQAGEDIMEHH